MLVDGVENARLLGGYKGLDGRKVKKGLLIRSGRLSDIEKEGEMLLKELGLTTVIDIRTASERDKKPDKAIEGVENIFIEWVDALSVETGKLAKEISKCMDIEAVSNPAAPLVRLVELGFNPEEMYVNELKNSYAVSCLRRIFEILMLPSSQVVLYHCSSGKDRTGITSAMILSALGVDRATILGDFEMTNHFYSKRRNYIEAKARECTDDEKVIYQAKALAGVEYEYMKRALDYLDETYGSPVEYLKQVIGLSEADIKKLQEKYLEPLLLFDNI